MAVFFILEIILLVRLWHKSAGVTDALRARLGKSFAAFYLARYLIIPLFIILVPPIVRGFFFILFLNAVPIVWLRIFFRAYEVRLGLAGAGRPAVGAADLDTFCRTFDISKRERDILGLILAGKSNRDIERELFISYHTVKNHVYNLFHKLGVKNRFELARLVENRAREASRTLEGNSDGG
jgi:DNA-binding CsgD family transcriptional regulator